MKRTLLTFLLILNISGLVHGQYRLEIDISGIKNNKGLIMLQLLDENRKVVRQAKGTISDGKSVIIFSDLKTGNYAFQYYHDENLSEVMETGPLGKPKEGYGFSNNAAGPFGPKPFREWLFSINKDIKVTASPRY